MRSSIIANLQEQSCYGIANGIFANPADMDGNAKDRALIQALSEWTKKSPSEIARKAGLAVTTLTRPLNKDVNHTLSNPTIGKLRAKFPDFPGWRNQEADIPDAEPALAYVSIEVLPTYAGAGGGGTGDDDRATALVARALIEGELHGKPDDFVLVPIKGDSMEPDFYQGDQVLCDKRDRSPAQPGPFAIWDGEWGEYVMKNVERIEGGRVRMFSSNPKYSPTEIQHDETRIIGRPVWFGRRC